MSPLIQHTAGTAGRHGDPPLSGTSVGRAFASRRRQRKANSADTPDIRADDIQVAIETLASSYRNPNNSLKFRITGGWVFLSGEVDWHYQKMEIELAVSRTRGVCGLTSDLAVLGTRNASPALRGVGATPFHQDLKSSI
jgi:osmotically-inducible protein OsmY